MYPAFGPQHTTGRAYATALQWYITEDEKYTKECNRILTTWSPKLKCFTETNKQLYGGEIVTSLTADEHDGNIPVFAMDGNLDSRWSADGDGHWIRFDLGTAATVTELRIAYWVGNRRKSKFDIQSSDNGTQFKDLKKGLQTSGNTIDFETYDVPDTKTRFIRLLCHGNSSNGWNSIAEVAIMGSGGVPTYAMRKGIPQPLTNTSRVGISVFRFDRTVVRHGNTLYDLTGRRNTRGDATAFPTP